MKKELPGFPALNDIEGADVVINFHSGDQNSARHLMELLLVVDEGIPCKYHLQYGSSIDTISVGNTILKFMDSKNAVISSQFPEIEIPGIMIEDDPNLEAYGGNQAKRNKKQKWSIFQWNLCVYKYMLSLDYFLMLEPDCVVLKDGWLKDIVDRSKGCRTPVFGHAKQGRIGGRPIYTHWAGCSLYNCRALRELPITQSFRERFPNPWWKYRNDPGTTVANNCFFGPVVSGYDVSFDYLFFLLYFMEITGEKDPMRWPLDALQSNRDVIFCDFHSSLTSDQVFTQFLNRISVIHGIKEDHVRDHVTKYFRFKNAEKKRGKKRSVIDTPPLNSTPLSLGGPVKNPLVSNSDLLDITDLQDRLKDERCFIIGNGPSLKSTDLTLLKNEYTIGLNRIYLNFDKMNFQPTFYCAVNPNVIRQFGHEIDQLHSIKFLRHETRRYITNHWNCFFMESYGVHDFNRDISDFKWCEGWTVTYCAMQVAYYLGFNDVYLVGVDHRFVNVGTPNKLNVAQGDDPNHFHPSYFGKGIKWDYPDLERSETSYKVARKQYDENGRSLFDATIGGNLNVFPKVDYMDLFN